MLRKDFWREKLGTRASAILKGVGVHSLSCTNLIGEMKISKVRDLNAPSETMKKMASEIVKRNDARIKKSSACEDFYPIFRNKNNVES